MIRTLTEQIVMAIVDCPEEVVVHEKKGLYTLLIRIETKKSDVGYVIGRSGKIIKSIRLILQAAGAKLNKRVVVELLD